MRVLFANPSNRRLIPICIFIWALAFSNAPKSKCKSKIQIRFLYEFTAIVIGSKNNKSFFRELRFQLQLPAFHDTDCFYEKLCSIIADLRINIDFVPVPFQPGQITVLLNRIIQRPKMRNAIIRSSEWICLFPNWKCIIRRNAFYQCAVKKLLSTFVKCHSIPPL